ncbi:cytoplasmic phosphatidylinositol transfer protein 1-like isoform X4 [Coturnix japonica]|uniref:cytoplasmic phosphatidylinositol transfer protein 1-like isoform X4 n=1 Tax=Coturnix japonica TaxID=93934 RepID=UPI000776B355|nr:cytoplasmic phosphatidylinositol transfer protein 1-like isoform X4 [Coturnix japonica]
MLVKEYRICMPLTTEEYRVGQLYTISKHSHQESEKGEGVEVVRNEPHEDPVHGPGQFTEKRVHLSSKLPSWARAVTPRIFYITEKAWNYYPYTITEYTCSFLPKFSIYIETKYEDNCGDSENIFHSDKILGDHEVSFLDIAFDEIPERYYRSLEVIRDILLIGHRQAFTWVDEWCGMTMEEVRQYERETQEATNEIIGLVTPTISVSEVGQPTDTHSAPASAPSTPLSDDAPDFLAPPKARPRKKSAPETLTLPALRERASAE